MSMIIYCIDTLNSCMMSTVLFIFIRFNTFHGDNMLITKLKVQAINANSKGKHKIRYIKQGFLLLNLLAAGIHMAVATETPKQMTDTNNVDELTVTAQKREQMAKEVPVSLETFTDKDIDNRHLTRTEDVVNQAVNVDMGTISGGLYDTFAQIRGVGSNIIGIDPSVGMFIDNAPVTDSQAYSFGLLDIQRVEVMRGPQGTLYGRNTLAGAVNFITSKPVFGNTSFAAGVETGSYGKTRVQGIVNLPLGSEWALRVAAAGLTSNGMTHNSAAGQSKTNKLTGGQVRVSLRGFVNDNLEILTVYEHSQQNPRDGAYMPEQDFLNGSNTVNINNVFHGKLIGDSLRHYMTWNFDDGSKLISTTSLSRNTVDYAGSGFPNGYWAATEFGYDNAAPGLAAGSLGEYAALYDAEHATFVPALNFHNRVDNPYNSNYKQVTEEIRYQSNSDSVFKWLAGVYGEYSNAERVNGATSTYHPVSASIPSVTAGTPPLVMPILADNHYTASSIGKTKTASVALFGDASLAFTNQLEALAGLRVGYDHKRFDYSFNIDSKDNLLWQSLLGSTFLNNYQSSLSTTYAMPRVGLRYQFTDGTQSYLTISRGFKTGGFNDAFVPTDGGNPYKNESLMSYELGIKSDLISRHLNLNAAVFYVDRHNQQVQTFDTGNSSPLVTNAPRSRSYGGELTFNARLDEHWSGYAGIGYTDATYRDFTDAPGLNETTGEYMSVNATDKQQQYIPKVTANVGIAYTWNLGIADLTGRGDLGYQYRSGYYFDPTNTQKQPGFGLLNARLTAGNKNYQVYIWGNNLTNERYRSSETNLGYGNLVTLADLRTVGIGVNAKF